VCGGEPVPKPDWVAYQLSAEVDAFLADGLGVTADRPTAALGTVGHTPVSGKGPRPKSPTVRETVTRAQGLARADPGAGACDAGVAGAALGDSTAAAN